MLRKLNMTKKWLDCHEVVPTSRNDTMTDYHKSSLFDKILESRNDKPTSTDALHFLVECARNHIELLLFCEFDEIHRIATYTNGKLGVFLGVLHSIF